MRALVTGATGLIGRRLLGRLDRPIVLSRDPEKARVLLGTDIEVLGWDPTSEAAPVRAFRGVDVVFHLAGEPVAEGRWNEAKKDRIRESRVAGTRHLVAALQSLTERPGTLICGSAVGFYGDRGDEVLEETSGPGEDFLAQVCQEWEAEAQRAASVGVRVVTARTGIVLDGSGGALAKMLPPFKLGLGGRLGSGRQWMPWITLEDHVAMLLHAADNAVVSGPMNAVGPAPVTNSAFTHALGAALRRPAIFPVPKFALRLAVGDVAEVVLASQRVMPRVAEKTGFRFRHKTLAEALRAALGGSR